VKKKKKTVIQNVNVKIYFYRWFYLLKCSKLQSS